ncbi:group I intron-associated PD-(D/E)XK endonuclease [Nocardioides sp. Kera G14]|uniref:group I intron-associated PD-(D/E)XK endonuclease n=1 Tax=Nocardioides sp. Kera G14 TaxID=2884264 RepID=UPI001D10BCB4|nr:group I intron-associated PD-(D/E)XK endonuclease [Nocardioides sp. Kera G14]UDY25255.1 hypothetical protein LH076_08205 [Nocardioides sp. Kera G14]
MSRVRRYTDSELAAAVAVARSWRGVLRELGLAATSAAQMRSVRRTADELGLDYDHFTGQRRWSDAQLREAVASSGNWSEVAAHLGLAGGSSTSTIKGHALRLGLPMEHFGRVAPDGAEPLDLVADKAHLSRSGPMLAAAWFSLRGCAVSWPLEPARYDLLLGVGERLLRVQVKTTTYAVDGSWVVRLSTAERSNLTYDPDEIDHFFVIDGDLGMYLIPSRSVGGLQELRLSAYAEFRVARLAEFVGSAAAESAG